MIANNDHVVLTCGGYIGTGFDSITAEYAGLDALLRYLIADGITRAVVHGDCAAVIAGVQGACRVMPQHEASTDLIVASLALLPFVKLKWIPRNLNSQAHILASAAQRNHATMRSWGDCNNGNSNGQPTIQPATKPMKRCARIRRKMRQFLASIIDRL
jgi:hypothetical protein